MIDFHPAGLADDAELRAMLHDNAMPSWATMTLEREPSFFAGLNRYGRDRAVVARQHGRAVGMYVCSEHPVHVNGEAVSAGYLGGLRVNRPYRNRLRILRDGYASIRSQAVAGTAPYWYTSIAAENPAARRLLEANLPGMPRYHRLGEMLTLALPRSRGRGRNLWRPLAAGEEDAACTAYNIQARGVQFSPVLRPEWLGGCGAKVFVRDEQGTLAGTMTLWNQQDYKQVVARGYRLPLALARPIYNLWARFARRVSLPAIGRRLDQSFLAFFAPGVMAADEVAELVGDALALCETQVLCLGLHGEHPALPNLLRRFRPLTYRSIIYAVSFAEPPVLDARPVQPEVAIL